jgi:hypothetical protein
LKFPIEFRTKLNVGVELRSFTALLVFLSAFLLFYFEELVISLCFFPKYAKITHYFPQDKGSERLPKK